MRTIWDYTRYNEDKCVKSIPIVVFSRNHVISLLLIKRIKDPLAKRVFPLAADTLFQITRQELSLNDDTGDNRKSFETFVLYKPSNGNVQGP